MEKTVNFEDKRKRCKEGGRTWKATRARLCTASPMSKKFFIACKLVTCTPTSKNPTERRNSSCSNAIAYSFWPIERKR
jgi:hypothetical protein